MKKCREVMTGDPVCCVPTDTAARAAKLMKAENIGSVPVCEDRHNRKLLGIVTDRDLALYVVAEDRDANSTKVHDVPADMCGLVHQDHDIERISVFGQRGGNKTEVEGKAQSFRQ